MQWDGSGRLTGRATAFAPGLDPVELSDGSEFDSTLWSHEVGRGDGPRPDGEAVVITGSNTGIGFHMARAMASKGASVVMACRSAEKAERARDATVSELPDSEISVMELDFADLSSVEGFSKDLIADSVGWTC